MIFLRKKTIYKLSVFICHFFLSVSIYASDKETGFFDGFLSSSNKPSHKTSSVPIALPSQLPQTPQRTFLDQVTQLPNQVSMFLQAFPKILGEMAELERHIPTLIPEHRRNPMNLYRQPKRGDWRVLMACSIEGKLKIFKTVDEIFEDLNKKRALEKVNGSKGKPQGLGDQSSDAFIKETEHEAMSRIRKMLHLWFFRMCSPGAQALDRFKEDYEHFGQWWDKLPPQLIESQNIFLIGQLLDNKEDSSAEILKLLNNLFVHSLLLTSQSLYEDLLPTFMDLKTSNSTLFNRNYSTPFASV
jgi:hypothetical protein